MELRYARLGKVQYRGDFLQCHLVVIVKCNDGTFFFREIFNSGGKGFLDLRPLRMFNRSVLKRDRAVRTKIFLQRDHGCGADLTLQMPQPLARKPEFCCKLLVRCSAA